MSVLGDTGEAGEGGGTGVSVAGTGRTLGLGTGLRQLAQSAPRSRQEERR